MDVGLGLDTRPVQDGPSLGLILGQNPGRESIVFPVLHCHGLWPEVYRMQGTFRNIIRRLSRNIYANEYNR